MNRKKSAVKRITLRELAREEIPSIYALMHLNNPKLTRAVFSTGRRK